MLSMSSGYKENNFSTQSLSTSLVMKKNNKNKTIKPNIEDLKKKIFIERRREKRNTVTFGAVCLSTFLMFYFFQN
jgi:hypothetical protein